MINRLILTCVMLLSLMSPAVLPAQTAAGGSAIEGTVLDETALPLIGASVRVAGSNPPVGVITDIDGNFVLQVSTAETTLEVSYVGFETATIKARAGSRIEIVLKENSTALEEVVAIGYATMKKSDLTGSVEKVSMDDLQRANVSSFDQALGGRIAGVQVVASDGQPGEGANIVIRGSNTISDEADGTPLYVIDGFATDDPNAGAINPADIESIDILKDASATAIYGARGANGVIIITTKRGAESAPRISYEGSVSYQRRPKGLKLMQGRQFVELQAEMLTADEMNKTYFSYDEALGRYQTIDDYDKRKSTNWQDEVFRNAPMTNHHLALTGGTKNTRYSTALSYYLQEGTIIKSSYESVKARATLDQQISPTVKAGTVVNFANNTSIGSAPTQGDGQSTQYFLYQVLAYRPVKYRSTDDLEDIVDNNGGTYPYNPVKTIKNTYEKLRNRQLSMNAYLNWNILPDLLFKVTFAYTWREARTEKFYNKDTYFGDPAYSPTGTNGSFNIKEWNSWSNEYTLNYRRQWGSHKFNGLVGMSLSSKQISNVGAKSVLIPWDDLGFWGIDTGSAMSVVADNVTDKMMSYFGRFNYDYRGRYLLTATLRADGSSRFIHHKWGLFPSASVAWRVIDEPFMRSVSSWMSNLKLRVGWGATGNNATREVYPSNLLYWGGENYPWNNSLHPAIHVMQLANRSLRWETTYQTNIGIDFALLQNRINGSVDIYDKDTRDLLLYADVPPSIGFTQVQQNIGSISNRGLELTLNGTIFPGKHGSVKWTSSFNISFNKNKITGLSDGQESRMAGIRYPSIPDLYICKVGRPLSEMYGYIYDGVYQYSDFDEVSPGVFRLKDNVPDNTNDRANIRPGDPKLRDINGDGRVTTADRTIIGHGLPVHTGGFINNFEWKGFDLSIFLQWSYGNDVINYNRVLLENLQGRHLNQLATAANHWRPDNPTNYLWAPNRGLNVHTSRDVEDASFLRLKNIQLGYTFPAKWLRGTRLSGVRAYLSAQNVATWTGYSGYDPEVSTRNSAMTRGFDYSAYPKAQSFTFGVKIDL